MKTAAALCCSRFAQTHTGIVHTHPFPEQNCFEAEATEKWVYLDLIKYPHWASVLTRISRQNYPVFLPHWFIASEENRYLGWKGRREKSRDRSIIYSIQLCYSPKENMLYMKISTVQKIHSFQKYRRKSQIVPSSPELNQLFLCHKDEKRPLRNNVKLCGPNLTSSFFLFLKVNNKCIHNMYSHSYDAIIMYLMITRKGK